MDHSRERHSLEQMRRSVAGLLGARAEIAARCAALRKNVSEAKGRTAIKGRVDTFLEELQADAHRRNLSSFERLLTLLVSDVMPNSNPIGLELSTERGLPSLDIFTRRPDGTHVDVYADQGGSITNIVSAGLRVIATVKAKGRLFLVLDEPDCWIKPDRIQDFYRVFRQTAEQVGVQCLVISHHSHLLLGEGIALAELEINGVDDASIRSADGIDHLWTPEKTGIRSIRLRNFQSHTDSEIKLSPGVTAVIGPNNGGKSSVVRALVAAIYGDTRDSLIRHGEKECLVDIVMEGGRTLGFSRARKRNPVNIWTLRDAEGQIVEENGTRFETGSRAVPEWVAEKTGIAPVDNLRIHISDQKTPVFLLGEPPSRRASVLSVGQESSHLREMIGIQRERAQRDVATARDGERELGLLEARLKDMETLGDLEAKLAQADERLTEAERLSAEGRRLTEAAATIEALRAKLDLAVAKRAAYAALPSDAERERLWKRVASSGAAAAVLERIDSLTRQLGSARARVAVLYRLPAKPAFIPTDGLARLITTADACAGRLAFAKRRGDMLAALPEAAPRLKPADTLGGLVEAIGKGETRLTLAARRTAILAQLPSAPPVLISSRDLVAAGVAVSSAVKALGPAKEQLSSVVGRIASLEAELDVLLAEMGNMCPTCGQGVRDVAAFLRDEHQRPGEAA